MAAIRQFEDIRARQKGRELCKMVYDLTGKGCLSRDYGLRDQMRRASVSVISNIAEGFEHQNNRSFIRFLYIAKASAGELPAQAYVTLDQHYITQQQFDALTSLATETSRLISAFIAYLSKHPDHTH